MSLRALLKDERGAVRRAALLALLESRALEPAEVKPLVQDRDPGTSEIAANWLAKSDGNPLIDIYPRPGDFVDSVTPKITPGIKPATVRFTLDGSEPTPKSRSGSPGPLTATTTLKAALFVGDQKVGNTLVGTYRKRESNLTLPVLGTVSTPTTVAQVLPLLAAADPKRGPGLFKAAGCVACHRAGDEGRAIGPDLSTIGDRDDADSVIRSILSPNQIIVEGYGLLTVSTRDGKGFAGIFESETDRTLRMVQLNGEAVAIDKSTISSRQNIHQSPMPAYRPRAESAATSRISWRGSWRSARFRLAPPRRRRRGTSLPRAGKHWLRVGAQARPAVDRPCRASAGRLCLQRSQGAPAAFPEPSRTERGAGDPHASSRRRRRHRSRHDASGCLAGVRRHQRRGLLAQQGAHRARGVHRGAGRRGWPAHVCHPKPARGSRRNRHSAPRTRVLRLPARGEHASC